MADLITWKTIAAPSVAAELAEARKAQEGIGAAFDSLGSRVEDYAAGKQKRETDAFIADLNAAANDEERQKMISDAESGWLNMGRVTEAARDAELHDFARAGEQRAKDELTLQQELAKQAAIDSTGILAQQYEEMGIEDEDRDETRRILEDQHKLEMALKQKQADTANTLANKQMLAAEEKMKLFKRQTETWIKDSPNRQALREKHDREYKEAKKTHTNKLALIKVQGIAENDYKRGSQESKDFLNAQAKLLRKAGMPPEEVRQGLQPYRDLDLAQSLGISEKAGAEINALNFTIPDPNNPPSIYEFKRYKKNVARIIKKDNPGASAAGVKAKVFEMTDNEVFRSAEALAERVEENIQLQNAARIKTQAEIVADGESFHIAIQKDNELAHIEKLLRKNHKDAYSIMSQEDLRDDIQLTLKAMYEHYKPTSDAQRSALAKVVYRLYAMSRADKGGIMDMDVIGVPGTEYGLLFDTSLGELAENSFSKLQQTIGNLGLLPSESKLPPGERKIESASQAILPQKDRRKRPPTLSPLEKYKQKLLRENPPTSVTISDQFKKLIK